MNLPTEDILASILTTEDKQAEQVKSCPYCYGKGSMKKDEIFAIKFFDTSISERIMLEKQLAMAQETGKLYSDKWVKVSQENDQLLKQLEAVSGDSSENMFKMRIQRLVEGHTQIKKENESLRALLERAGKMIKAEVGYPHLVPPLAPMLLDEITAALEGTKQEQPSTDPQVNKEDQSDEKT